MGTHISNLFSVYHYCCCFPFSHFWTVQSSEDKIVEKFDESVKASLGIFLILKLILIQE